MEEADRYLKYFFVYPALIFVGVIVLNVAGIELLPAVLIAIVSFIGWVLWKD